MSTSQISFDFRNASLGETMPTLFGWWNVQPPPPALSFALPSASDPLPIAEPVWAVGLESSRPFRANDYVVGLSSGRDEAQRQLQQILQLASQPESYAVGVLSPQAQTLLTEIEELGPAGEGVAFAPQSRSWAEALSQFRALLQQIGQSIGHFAWVETRLDGQLLARTRVNWLGDFNSLLAPSLAAGHQAQHQQALIAALASRTALLEIFSLALDSAAQLAKLPVLLSTPAGAFLAVPLILRFINNIIAATKNKQVTTNN